MNKTVYMFFCKWVTVFALGVLGISPLVQAEASDISLSTLSETASNAKEEFEAISRDLGRAISIGPANSPEPLGLLGFNAGVEVLFVKVDSTPFKNASGENIPGSLLPVPRLRVQKGLPFGVDVGVAYLPEANKVNVGMFGGELRIDLLETIPLPTPLLHFSGRVSYSKLTGVKELSLQTLAFDLSGGLNFPLIKPYAGIGQIRTRSSVDANLEKLLGIKKVDVNKGNFFAGVKLALIPFVPINIEYSNSNLSSLSIKAAVEF
ncbi:MAG: DUF6588 family protein [Nitrospinota bacterium]